MSGRMAWLLAVILGAIFATDANAQTENDKLRGCLTIEDGSKERLDCYDGIVPPDPKPKPPVAKVVADCKFLKEEDERLGCFNRVMQALNRHHVREFNPKEREPHWGRRKLARDR